MQKLRAFLVILAFSGVANIAAAQSFTMADSDKIVDTFDANMARFDRDYRGKVFTSSGAFRELSPAMIGDYYATFKASGQEFYCSEIRKGSAAANTLIDANSGQNFMISGTIKSVWFGAVELRDCSFQ